MSHEFDPLSTRVIGAAIDVHRALGPGFLEVTYARALRIALEGRGLGYHAEREVPLTYAGRAIGTYRLDLVVEDQVLVELKAVRRLEELHFAQVRAYLRATGLGIGLLLNFDAPILVIKRVVNGQRD